MDREIRPSGIKNLPLLGTLIRQLRDKGITIGIDQMLSAIALTLEERKPTDKDGIDYKYLLASVLCSSSDEQSTFYETWETLKGPLTLRKIEKVNRVKATKNAFTLILLGLWQRYKVTLAIVLAVAATVVLSRYLQTFQSGGVTPKGSLASVPPISSGGPATGRQNQPENGSNPIFAVVLIGCLISFVSYYLLSLKAVFRRCKSMGTDLLSPLSLASSRRLAILRNYDRAGNKMRLWSKIEREDTLDVRATALATARRGGAISPRFKAIAVRTSYLFVVERLSGADLLWEQVSLLSTEIRKRGSSVELCSFDAGNPGGLVTVGEGGRRTARGWYASSDCKAVVWCGPDLLSHPLSLKLRPDVLEFLSESRAIVVAPFINSPALKLSLSKAGIQVTSPRPGSTIMNLLGFSAHEVGDVEYKFPSILKNKLLEWQFSTEEPIAVWNRLLVQLKAFLDGPGMLALAACAAYPELRMDFVDEFTALFAADVIQYETILSKLVQLPWMRYGFMPDWIRVFLLLALTDTDREYLRSTIEGVFEKRLGISREAIGHKVGTLGLWHRLIRQGTESLLRRNNAQMFGEDRVFATFLLNGDLRGLLRTPASLLTAKRKRRPKVFRMIAYSTLVILVTSFGLFFFSATASDSRIAVIGTFFAVLLSWYLTFWQLVQMDMDVT